ncbi:hypothetical protein, partial [Thalassospira xianhensis]|uniref:hypothetical protein n=1 Tax=Thalassospira xianhensis TaxID=478503 RepID=UPI001ABFCBB3
MIGGRHDVPLFPAKDAVWGASFHPTTACHLQTVKIDYLSVLFLPLASLWRSSPSAEKLVK